MSRIIGDSECPRCREHGRDRTKNHLILFEDGGKHCNRCGYTVRPDNSQIHEPDLSKESPSTIERYAPYAGSPIRGIPNSIRALYGDRVAVDTDSGEPVKVFYRKGKGFKVRELETKRFYAIGDTKGATELYGQNALKSSTLIICGGEEDAKAAQAMLAARMPHNQPHCVSLPDGETNFSAISANLDWINKHKRVILAMDMDDVGQQANGKIAALLDRPCHVAEMPHKDANECLLLGAEKEFVACVVEAKRFSPGGIVRIADLMEAALERPSWGVEFPWPSLTAATYGMRPGEGYYIGAGPKIGKSEFLNELVKHLTSLCKKSFVVKAEEVVKKTARKLAGKLIRRVLHRPDVEVDVGQVRGALEKLDEYVLLYDRSNSLDWEDVKAAIRHAVIVEGCEFVFIDPVTCFTDGMEAKDANTFLQKFSRELDQLAKDLGFTYFCFCHLNNPTSGPDHNRGGAVLTSQFTGSRAMSRTTTYMIGIERNKDPKESEEVQNTSWFVLLDDRENGNVCRFSVMYDKETGDYLEPLCDV